MAANKSPPPSKSTNNWLVRLAGIAILKPAVTTLAFCGIRALVDPLYASPQCGLRVVNETMPQVYAAHPAWSGMVYDDSCSGETLDLYRNNQFSKFESKLGITLVLLHFWVSVVMLIYQLKKTKWNGVSHFLRYSLAAFLASYMMTSLVLMQFHLELDVTYITGALLHHAEDDTPGINQEKATIPQGYLICGMPDRYFYGFVAVVLVSSNARLRDVFNPWLLFAFLNFGVLATSATSRAWHNKYHLLATPEMVHAWPFTFNSRAYHHVFIHHETGRSFSGDPLLNPIFDFLLHAFGKLHNEFLGLELDTRLHYLFVTIFDAVTGIIGIAILKVFLHLAAAVAPANPTKTTAKVKFA